MLVEVYAKLVLAYTYFKQLHRNNLLFILLHRNHLLFIQWPSIFLPIVRYIFCQLCGIYNFSASIHATSPRNQLLSITAFSTQPVVIHHSCIHATSCYSFQRRIHNSTTLSLAKLKVSLILDAASLGTTSETPNCEIWARRKLAHATWDTARHRGPMYECNE